MHHIFEAWHCACATIVSWIVVCVTFLWLSLEHNSFVKLLISGMGHWDSDCQSVAVWFACWLYKFSRMSIVCLWHYIYVGVSINMHSMWSDWLIFWSHGNATSEPPVCGRGCCWWHRCFLALCNGSDNAPDPNPDSVLQISFPNLHFVCSEILFAIIGSPSTSSFAREPAMVQSIMSDRECDCERFSRCKWDWTYELWVGLEESLWTYADPGFFIARLFPALGLLLPVTESTQSLPQLVSSLLKSQCCLVFCLSIAASQTDVIIQ